MDDKQVSFDRPIRVVLFGGGPTLEYGVKQFFCRLEDHPHIEFLGGFCQSQGQSLNAVGSDLWRRRGLLALPLFAQYVGSDIVRFLSHSRSQSALNEQLAKLADRIHFVPDIHAANVLAEVQALEPDLGLVYGSPILKPALFEIPAYGTLGIHHGKVPQYRGKKTTFWAMYNGEKTAGVTIQKINAGLDTGQIVKSGEVPIGSRSRSQVWNNLEALGLDLYIQAILEVKEGTANFKPQEGPKGRLYRDPEFRQILELWWIQTKKRFGFSTW